ncbi:hypothetical protein FXO38_30019 [Capsicum annuum]|nr:hypothetical protein FXO38_30019 [Capsicum annuum]KAF3646831.1 hypothetical protein FXO37_20263 [Capsicum annuum]
MSSKRKETESGSTSDHPTKKARVQMDSEELPEQAQSGKYEAEKSYEKRGEEGYIEAGEENKSEEKEKDKQDDNGSPMGREIRSKSQHEAVKTTSIDRFSSCDADR